MLGPLRGPLRELSAAGPRGDLLDSTGDDSLMGPAASAPARAPSRSAGSVGRKPLKKVASRSRGTSSSMGPPRVVSLRSYVPFSCLRRPKVCSTGSALRCSVISACKIQFSGQFQQDPYSPAPWGICWIFSSSILGSRWLFLAACLTAQDWRLSLGTTVAPLYS